MGTTTQDLHDMMRKYFKPTEGYMLCEYIEKLSSTGGIILAMPEKTVGYPVVTSSEESIKEGTWVVPSANFTIQTFSVFNRKWFYVRLFDLVSIVDMEYLLADEEFKKQIGEETRKKQEEARLKQFSETLNIIN